MELFIQLGSAQATCSYRASRADCYVNRNKDLWLDIEVGGDGCYPACQGAFVSRQVGPLCLRQACRPHKILAHRKVSVFHKVDTDVIATHRAGLLGVSFTEFDVVGVISNVQKQ